MAVLGLWGLRGDVPFGLPSGARTLICNPITYSFCDGDLVMIDPKQYYIYLIKGCLSLWNDYYHAMAIWGYR